MPLLLVAPKIPVPPQKPFEVDIASVSLGDAEGTSVAPVLVVSLSDLEGLFLFFFLFFLRAKTPLKAFLGRPHWSSSLPAEFWQEFS